MKTSQIRAQAREKLSGNWGKAALLTFTFLAINFIISYGLQFIILGPLLSFILLFPLTFGLLSSYFRMNDENKVGYFAFLELGLSNSYSYFGKTWSVIFHTFLKLLIPILLVIGCDILLVLVNRAYLTSSVWITNSISNFILTLFTVILFFTAIFYLIMKQFSYKLSLFVLYDNPEISGKEAVEKSAELMKGNIWSLICLNLSFLGWAFVSSLTFGIGLFWLIPYKQISEINFYRNLAGEPSFIKKESF